VTNYLDATTWGQIDQSKRVNFCFIGSFKVTISFAYLEVKNVVAFFLVPKFGQIST
jgi:hypothetical protein